MSVSSIGSDASQLFHLLKERRQHHQAAASSTAATTQTAGTATASTGDPTQPDGIGKSAAKLLTDLKSLLIGVQSGSATATTTPTNTTGTATNAATDAAGTATTDPASTVLDDLTSLFGNLQKAVGSGHHHHHGPSTSDAGTQAATGDTATAAQPSAGLLDSFAKALKAYASQTASATSVSSTAVSA